jgi:hypothetical protein
VPRLSRIRSAGHASTFTKWPRRAKSHTYRFEGSVRFDPKEIAEWLESHKFAA